MERLKHICVADGSAFRKGNIPGLTTLNRPDLYLIAKGQRSQLGSVEFSKIVERIAAQQGYEGTLPPDVRVAIQGGVVCAVAGCEVEIVNASE